MEKTVCWENAGNPGRDFVLLQAHIVALDVFLQFMIFETFVGELASHSA